MDIRAAMTSSTDHTVEHAIELLERALAILDNEHLLIAAAKIDDVRHDLRRSTGQVACLAPS